MRRYTIAIDGNDHVVDVEEVTANTFRVQIEGKSVDVRLRDHQDISQAMITPNVEVAQAHAASPATPVARRESSGGSSAAPSPSAAAAPPSRAAAPVTGAAGALTAPMPGVVLSVTATVGQQVSRGDTLLVLEAMKMKNELKAPKDGVIGRVDAVVGDQVGFGQVLVVFE